MRDVYLCYPKRTAIGRFGGGLSSMRPDDMAATVIRAVMEQCPNLDAASIDDVILGCANQAGEDNRNIARMAGLLAGLPDSVPGTTVNRLCGSGMDAIGIAARAIRAGEAELIVAGGVESMSRAPLVMGKAESAFSRTQSLEDTTIGWRFVNPLMEQAYGVDSMPETAENVAANFLISRADQDTFALASQYKAAQAQQTGRFDREIVAIELPRRKQSPLLVNRDEHLRPDTTAEQLAKLPTPFRDGGSVTAGNASGVNDGAAAMILASDQAVRRHGLQPLARIVGMAAAGVAPRTMGMGPVPAVYRLLERTQRSLGDMTVIELNEAFAAQSLACMRELGLSDDDPRVNPNGGAIALGHPLGMSGARLVMTAAHQLAIEGGGQALCTMCIGVGQGIALMIES